MARKGNETQRSTRGTVFSGSPSQVASASQDNDADNDAQLEELLGQVVEELNDRFQQGQQPALEDYLQQYPQLANPLRQAYEVLASLYAVREPGLPDAQFPEDQLPGGGLAEDQLKGGYSPGAPRQAAHSPAAQSSSVPLGQLGDFRLLRQIGRGGMGIVYEAEQLSLGRRVALKTLPLAAMLDPRQLQRFQNEARAAAMLDHPHIVGVFSVGSERGVYYYAMQYIDGRTLAEVISELRRQQGIDALPPAGPTVTQQPGKPPATLSQTRASEALASFIATPGGTPGASPDIAYGDCPPL